jgi:hypothetical protein
MENETLFKAEIVRLILFRKTEEALERLSNNYGVETPKIKIGMPKGNIKKVACYFNRTKTIYFSHLNFLYNPQVVLHEFYHHLRCHGGKHLGTEKNADRFAKTFLYAYMLVNREDSREPNI